MDKDALATAIAGGAIASALIETLLDKGILTLEESRGVLDRAMRAIGHRHMSEGIPEAMRLIGGLMSGRFSAR